MIVPAWHTFPIDQLSKAIIRGEKFQADVLLNRLVNSERGVPPGLTCNATIAHGKAVAQIALLTQSLDADTAPIDAEIQSTKQSILAGLTCLPSNAYLWLALFQIESLRTGLRSEYLSYLAMSYKQSPNEGWLAMIRNGLSFAIFPALDEKLQLQVIDEFCLLVRSQLYWVALDIYLGAAAPYREQIAAHMHTVPETNRQLFAVQIARLGIDPKIPGTSVVVRDRPY